MKEKNERFYPFQSLIYFSVRKNPNRYPDTHFLLDYNICYYYTFEPHILEDIFFVI